MALDTQVITISTGVSVHKPYYYLKHNIMPTVLHKNHNDYPVTKDTCQQHNDNKASRFELSFLHVVLVIHVSRITVTATITTPV